MIKVWIAAATLVALADPAYAVRCSQPFAPVVKVNASMTPQDMSTLRSDVAAFVAASDVFQGCLADQHNGADARLDANQAQKERVVRQFNDALKAFRKAHPGS